MTSNPQSFLADAGTLLPNSIDIVNTNPIAKELMLERVPNGVEGFMLDDEDQQTMTHIWPVGYDPVSGVPFAHLVSPSACPH